MTQGSLSCRFSCLRIEVSVHVILGRWLSPTSFSVLYYMVSESRHAKRYDEKQQTMIWPTIPWRKIGGCSLFAAIPSVEVPLQDQTLRVQRIKQATCIQGLLGAIISRCRNIAEGEREQRLRPPQRWTCTRTRTTSKEGSLYSSSSSEEFHDFFWWDHDDDHGGDILPNRWERRDNGGRCDIGRRMLDMVSTGGTI